MVCEWGMSARMGLINYGGGRSEHIFLGRDMIRNEEYSEVTAREIDEEIRKLVDGAHARTNEILSLHRDQLDLLATTLLERETLNAVDVYELLGMEEKLAAVKKAAEEAARVQAEELAALTAVKVTPQPEDDDETRRRRLEGLSLDDHPHHDDGGKPPKA
jgi:cell division protease FtsH